MTKALPAAKLTPVMSGPASSVAATLFVFRSMIEIVSSPLFGVMRVLAVVAHVDAPRILADADDLDDLVLARIDDADDAQVAVGGVEIAAVVGRRGDVDALDLAEVLVRIELRHAGHVGDLDLLHQLVPAHVDDADPVGAVVADVGLRAVRQERDVQRLGEAGDRLDLASATPCR